MSIVFSITLTLLLSLRFAKLAGLLLRPARTY